MPPRRVPSLRARRSRRAFLRLAVGACAGLGGAMLLGCGDEAPAANADGPGRAPRLVAPRGSDQPRAGTLRLGTTRETVAEAIRPLTSAQLVAVDPRTGLVHGDLAESVELRDGLEVAFRLREDLRFHPDAEGLAAALTAEDVRRDFQARRDAGEFLFSQVVTGIEAPDLRSVVLRLEAPFALLFEFLCDPLQGAVRSSDRYGVVDLPLGAGPFIPAAVRDDELLLGANPLYHRGGLPLVEAVSMRLAAQTAALDADFAGGTLDMRPGLVEVAEGAAVTSARRPARDLRGLALSLLPGAADDGPEAGRRAAAFQDQRVRSALALALDRDILLAAGASLSGPVGPAFRADALPATELAEHPLYQHAPTEARALLEAAGQVDLPFRLTSSDGRGQPSLADGVVQMWRAIGLAPRAISLAEREWQNALRSGDFEAIVFEVSHLATPDLGLRLHTSAGLEGVSPWGYSNPVYDAAVRRALTALDPGERARRSHEAQRTLLDDVPALLPLSATSEDASLSQRLGGYEWGAYGFNETYLAARWTVA